MDSTRGSTGSSPAAQGRYPAHHRLPARRKDPAVGAELHAALDARRELGPEYEVELVEGFLDRLEQTVDARVDARLAEHKPTERPGKQGLDGNQLALAIVSTSLGVPLSAITIVAGGSLLAFLVVWAGIVTVNLAAAVSRRR